MTTPDPPTERDRLRRELAGLACAVVGGSGLAVVAFEVHPLAGVGLLSVLLLAVGVYLMAGES